MTAPQDITRQLDGRSRVDHAVACAHRRWRVFPLCTPKPGGGCVHHGDQCRHPGKCPLLKGWTSKATTDEATIRLWWARWPDANVGILTGEASDLLVIDIDNRHGGAESWRRLEAEHGPLAQTPTVQTGDGVHRYYQYEDIGVKNGALIAPGIEVRTTEGSVVAAGSRHHGGAAYRWLDGAGPDDVPLAPFPQELLQRPQPTLAPAEPASLYFSEGHRNTQLTRIAGALRRHGASEDGLSAALQAVNQADGDPPLPASDVQVIARSVAHYQPGASNIGTTPRIAHGSPRHFRLLTIDELSNQPQTEWLVDGIAERGRVGMLTGAPAAAKSFVSLAFALSVATGRDWHGRPVKKGPVVVVAAEGGPGIRKRVAAWMQEQGVTEIPNAFFLLEDVQLLAPGDVEGLLRQIQDTCPVPVLIILDTLAACFVGGDENSAKETGMALAAARRIVNVTGATVLLVHHSGRQDETRERGSSALRGNVDVMVSVQKNGDAITLTNTKQKDQEPFEPIQLRLKQVELDDGETSCVLVDGETSCVLVAGDSPSTTSPAPWVNASQRRALGALASFGRDGASSAEWRQAIETTHRVECPERTFQNWRTDLVKKGTVELVPEKDNTYRVKETNSAENLP